MIYTKTGDKGTTSLIGGTRVSKDDIRLEAYGTFDELSAFVAVLGDSEGVDAHEIEVFDRIQNNLLVLESCLALESQSSAEVSKYIPRLTEDDVTFLEHEIDAINAQLEPLKYLIIPGGNILSSRAHVCRTVCRRAERNLVRMGGEYEVDDVLRRFVNRLSDYFFVLSRYFMKKANVAEKPWKPAK
ncbi:MAG: cob(I)yrinic acid a,c-diamide adenosyltransferase [Bacteroidales bacterium]|nr:cob(I)yrinic acid a,c-diamide adenosyltransferase [Bacteroidales bacterium]